MNKMKKSRTRNSLTHTHTHTQAVRVEMNKMKKSLTPFTIYYTTKILSEYFPSIIVCTAANIVAGKCTAVVRCVRVRLKRGGCGLCECIEASSARVCVRVGVRA